MYRSNKLARDRTTFFLGRILIRWTGLLVMIWLYPSTLGLAVIFSYFDRLLAMPTAGIRCTFVGQKKSHFSSNLKKVKLLYYNMHIHVNFGKWLVSKIPIMSPTQRLHLEYFCCFLLPFMFRLSLVDVHSMPAVVKDVMKSVHHKLKVMYLIKIR